VPPWPGSCSISRRLRQRSDSDSAAAASTAGLRYVRDDRKGIRRVKGPLGFKYIGPGDVLIRSKTVLRRIASLAVPPAWTRVWICLDPRGHLQATGRDARGRKQYRYHPAWRACRDETKYDRLPAFAAALPALHARTAADMARPGLPRAKVLATVVRLLEKSLIRVGNPEYARDNRSYGLTTLRDGHVSVRGSTLRFEFRGKSGVRHSVGVNDRRIARIVKQCRDLPGQELFQYIEGNGRRRVVNSADVNGYVKRVTGEAFTAKDFRTWAGTVLAVTALRELGHPASEAQARKNVLRAIEAVAGVLGNTRTVCRKSYIHPAILEAYIDGSLIVRFSARNGRKAPGLRADEAAVLRLLLKAGSKEARKRRAA
jgi:DNA topoisomerase-1